MPWDKTRMRMEKAARLEILNLGLTDAEIAEHIGLTHAGFVTMKTRLEYKQLKIQLMTGVISEMDDALGDDIKGLKDMLRHAVPIAMQNIVDAAIQTKDTKLKMEASKELLDRDGRFAKVSRIGLPSEEQGGFASKSDDEIAKALIAASKPPLPEPGTTIQ